MGLIIAANWKMHKTTAEAADFCRRLLEGGGPPAGIETLICPPFTALAAVQQGLAGSPVLLGGQDMHWSAAGAFTGEISAAMLLELGATHVIIGHSERRHLMGEDDQMVNKKVLAAIEHDLVPVLCVGETEEERQKGATEKVLRQQVEGALAHIAGVAVRRLVIAYEPVWAIGSGVAASAADAGQAARLVRGAALKTLGPEFTGQLQIQYGGSVNENNIAEFVSLPEIDGALVGGASLQADTFLALIAAAGETTR
ncbi:MAG: triose-phosphate isomerase [Firmicutes bacterium]|nr:triose-phosphate isomerase [Bacillota bacterium]